jgi:hypothetical protein
MRFRTVLLALALAPVPLAGAGQDSTVAVLSATSGAYMEAFTAFQAAYGAVKYIDVSKNQQDLPAGTRTAIAFGGRAASYPYPPGVNVVYCMAPGLFQKDLPAAGRAVKISMVPKLGLLLAKLRAVQPGLRRLRVFWRAPGFGTYLDAIKKEGAAAGIEVETVRVEDTDELPELLRRSLGKMDAFWLPPDPIMITPESLMIFREFSWDNGVPYYASSKAMAREGATASVSISFRDIGAAAARAAAAVDSGDKQDQVVFLEKAEITLNKTAAARCGIEFPPELVKEASAILP